MTYFILTMMFTVGFFFFGYGLATTIGLLPSAWGIVGVFGFVLFLIGTLSVSLVTLVTVQFWRQDQPHQITRRRAVLTSLSAATITFGAILASWQLRTGDFTKLQFQEWILFGSVVLSLQFVLGTVKPRRKRRLLLLGELAVVFGFVFLFEFFSTGETNLVSNSFVSGGASMVLLLFGGPLYLLGSRLSRVPQ
ncbi:hypothetical protein ACOZ4B_09770 [Haloferax prahovense]|uniref:hypothetical protein n=1 Tax=Haloferax TaxID=2251 RepID=UPI00209BD577|nr:hypothetical protein [Haloferax sp. AB510]MCO8265849.1 hypothetical protein [Haloferax sp. AB510]